MLPDNAEELTVPARLVERWRGKPERGLRARVAFSLPKFVRYRDQAAWYQILWIECLLILSRRAGNSLLIYLFEVSPDIASLGHVMDNVAEVALGR